MDIWTVVNAISSELSEWSVLLVTLINLMLVLIFIPWVLMTKPNTTSAVAWCLLILFLPFFGAIFFLIFGWQHVNRPLRRKRRHKARYRQSTVVVRGVDSVKHKADLVAKSSLERNPFPLNLANLALKYDAFPPTRGNAVKFYFEGEPLFADMLADIRAAKHHIHLETFIFQPDDYGELFLNALAEKARQGVQVRLLYDAMGSLKLNLLRLRGFRSSGAKCRAFLMLNPLRRRVQVNLRNHRKILVIDGTVGYCGGMNVGREYAGKDPGFGYWRDCHFRLEGPVVADLQHIFAEDWDFAAHEKLADPPGAKPGESYFQVVPNRGQQTIQVIESGPDQHIKSIREIYFAAILSARRRLWIASPYFIPDEGLLDALRLAGYRGVDVRLLTLFHPDKWIPLYAARYYWPAVLEAGVKVYQYTRGMMHSKIILVDDHVALVGTANLDNRSMYLNFEVNCVFYTPDTVALLAEQFQRDLHDAIRLDRHVYLRRPFAAQLLENACRLASPIL